MRSGGVSLGIELRSRLDSLGSIVDAHPAEIKAEARVHARFAANSSIERPARRVQSLLHTRPIAPGARRRGSPQRICLWSVTHLQARRIRASARAAAHWSGRSRNAFFRCNGTFHLRSSFSPLVILNCDILYLTVHPLHVARHPAKSQSFFHQLEIFSFDSSITAAAFFFAAGRSSLISFLPFCTVVNAASPSASPTFATVLSLL
jgi:hypothetical protein